MTRTEKIVLAIVLLGVGVFGRLVPHAPNVAPIGAVALISGMYFNRQWSWFLPVIALFLSDVYIGFYASGIMFSVYGSLILIAIGNSVSRREDGMTLIIRSVIGSIFFYLITNFAVWQFGTMYPHTCAGLAACFTAALPFFRNTCIGDIVYMFSIITIIKLYFRYRMYLRRQLTLSIHLVLLS